jgi:hypothetical protein
MFRTTQDHPQANKERTRNNKISTQWDPISFNSGYYKICVHLLNPTGHVMHHQQFNIQQLYALPTLYLCVSYLSENKQRLVPLTA